MQTCLVTGATGFLGRYLVRQLSQSGVRVRVLLRHPAACSYWQEAIEGELTDKPAAYRAALEGVDTVFHLAAIAHRQADAALYQYINCDATLALAKQAELSGVKRFVFVSSTKAMVEPGAVRRDESWLAWPVDAYGYSKRLAEQRLFEEIRIPQLAVIRPSLMYGAGVKGNLQAMLRAIDKGYFPPLPETMAERSMVSAEDVCRALVHVSAHAGANRQALIATDGEAYTAYGIYQAMRQALDIPPSRWTMPLGLLQAAGHCGDRLRHFWPSFPLDSGAIERLTGPAAYSSQALRALGWEPSQDFYEVLPAMVQAYRESSV